ncbi:hypothetical protein K504DRAFT_504118 [Pleomassaria siparia CBS 279.74]|uniref:Uncharacterized protein n=1 Tax=Pleomassaria siparia CBS 279.74 TaxID=1314801 RepID=A0A6G1K4V5_9PLEO|nr:hypothetical protein K504DRAFT_504118 [Pleomassaria siparia CBS 279.74]
MSTLDAVSVPSAQSHNTEASASSSPFSSQEFLPVDSRHGILLNGVIGLSQLLKNDLGHKGLTAYPIHGMANPFTLWLSMVHLSPFLVNHCLGSFNSPRGYEMTVKALKRYVKKLFNRNDQPTLIPKIEVKREITVHESSSMVAIQEPGVQSDRLLHTEFQFEFELDTLKEPRASFSVFEDADEDIQKESDLTQLEQTKQPSQDVHTPANLELSKPPAKPQNPERQQTVHRSISYSSVASDRPQTLISEAVRSMNQKPSQRLDEPVGIAVSTGQQDIVLPHPLNISKLKRSQHSLSLQRPSTVSSKVLPPDDTESDTSTEDTVHSLMETAPNTTGKTTPTSNWPPYAPSMPSAKGGIWSPTGSERNDLNLVVERAPPEVNDMTDCNEKHPFMGRRQQLRKPLSNIFPEITMERAQVVRRATSNPLDLPDYDEHSWSEEAMAEVEHFFEASSSKTTKDVADEEAFALDATAPPVQPSLVQSNILRGLHEVDPPVLDVDTSDKTEAKLKRWRVIEPIAFNTEPPADPTLETAMFAHDPSTPYHPNAESATEILSLQPTGTLARKPDLPPLLPVPIKHTRTGNTTGASPASSAAPKQSENIVDKSSTPFSSLESYITESRTPIRVAVSHTPVSDRNTDSATDRRDWAIGSKKDSLVEHIVVDPSEFPDNIPPRSLARPCAGALPAASSSLPRKSALKVSFASAEDAARAYRQYAIDSSDEDVPQSDTVPSPFGKWSSRRFEQGSSRIIPRSELDDSVSSPNGHLGAVAPSTGMRSSPAIIAKLHKKVKTTAPLSVSWNEEVEEVEFEPAQIVPQPQRTYPLAPEDTPKAAAARKMTNTGSSSQIALESSPGSSYTAGQGLASVRPEHDQSTASPTSSIPVVQHEPAPAIPPRSPSRITKSKPIPKIFPSIESQLANPPTAQNVETPDLENLPTLATWKGKSRMYQKPLKEPSTEHVHLSPQEATKSKSMPDRAHRTAPKQPSTRQVHEALLQAIHLPARPLPSPPLLDTGRLNTSSPYRHSPLPQPKIDHSKSRFNEIFEAPSPPALGRPTPPAHSNSRTYGRRENPKLRKVRESGVHGNSVLGNATNMHPTRRPMATGTHIAVGNSKVEYTTGAYPQGNARSELPGFTHKE